jgi:hypothetical protein
MYGKRESYSLSNQIFISYYETKKPVCIPSPQAMDGVIEFQTSYLGISESKRNGVSPIFRPVLQDGHRLNVAMQPARHSES